MHNHLQRENIWMHSSPLVSHCNTQISKRKDRLCYRECGKVERYLSKIKVYFEGSNENRQSFRVAGLLAKFPYHLEVTSEEIATHPFAIKLSVLFK